MSGQKLSVDEKSIVTFSVSKFMSTLLKYPEVDLDFMEPMATITCKLEKLKQRNVKHIICSSISSKIGHGRFYTFAEKDKVLGPLFSKLKKAQ